MKSKLTPDQWRGIRNVLFETLVYGILVTVYAASVLQLLSEPLAELYRENMTWYAWLSLALIVIQGVVLEGLTSFLLDRLRLPRFH